MSQTSAAPASSQPSITGCRWAYCRLFFSTHADLVHHVIHDHVRSAVPVMRKDLAMIRRAEEGSGESLSVFALSFPRRSEELSTNKGEQDVPSNRDIPPEIQPSSSLPSPPASSPTSTSPLPPVPVHGPDRVSPVPELPEPDSDTDTSSESEAPRTDRLSPTPDHRTTTTSSRHLTPLVRYNSPVTPLPRRARYEQATPSFAALSSPADSPPIPPAPPTPSFNSQVESATGKRKRDDRTPSKYPPRAKLPFRKSINSYSPSCSQDSFEVEKHLTQSMEVDDSYAQAESVTGYTQAHPVAEGTPGAHATALQWKGLDAGVSQHKPLQKRTGALLESTTPPQQLPDVTPLAHANNFPAPALRQAWYGTRPPAVPTVKQKKTTLGVSPRVQSNVGPSQASSLPHPKTPTSGQPRWPRPPSLNVYRSGILEIAPPAVTVADSETQGEVQEDFDPHSQSHTEESSLEYLSYPLQTQAPYQSQLSQ